MVDKREFQKVLMKPPLLWSPMQHRYWPNLALYWSYYGSLSLQKLTSDLFWWFSLQLGSILPSTSCENPCYIQQSINCMMKLTCNNAIIVQILFFLPADFFWLWLFHHQDQCQNNCFMEVPRGQGQFLENNQKSYKMAKQLPKW